MVAIVNYAGGCCEYRIDQIPFDKSFRAQHFCQDCETGEMEHETRVPDTYFPSLVDALTCIGIAIS